MSCKVSGPHAEQAELRGLIQDGLVPVAMLLLQPTSQLPYSYSFFPFSHNFLTFRQYDPGGKILFPLGLSFSIWKTKIRLAQWLTVIHFDDVSLPDAVHPSTHLGVPRCNTAQGSTTICQLLCDGESVLCWLWIKFDASCSNLFSPQFHCADD